MQIKENNKYEIMLSHEENVTKKKTQQNKHFHRRNISTQEYYF